MNVNTLQSPPVSQLQRASAEAAEKDAEFLSFKLLNKRARVRLSPDPLHLHQLPGKAHLFAVANLKGWFVAATRNANTGISLVFSPLPDLRSIFMNPTPESDELPLTPVRTLLLSPATPNLLAFSSSDTRLIIGLTQGPISVFDTSHLFSPGTEQIQPLHTFQSTTGSAPRQILPNPGDMPDLVAVLREPDGTPNAQTVEILDVQKMESVGGWRSGGTPDTTPSSLSWSPKGKQLAVGLHSGDIVTFSPTSTAVCKSIIPKPPRAGDGNQCVAAATWLSNPTFHTAYSPVDLSSTDQTHFIVSLDSKSNSSADVKLATPCLPFPALRPASIFTLVLRNWDSNTKHILIIGDSASSDISVIAGLGEPENWYNLSLEEAGRPSLPLDSEMNDTVLAGLELDLTSTEPCGEGAPAPILYAYASDGTVLGWYVVHASRVAYPGMVPSASSVPSSAFNPITSSDQPAFSDGSPQPQSAFGGAIQANSALSTTPGADVFGRATSAPTFSQMPFGSQIQATPAFGQSTFGQPQSESSGFGQPSAFGQQSSSPFGKPSTSSAFGQQSAPAFGQASFGQTSPSSAFGQPSAFGQIAKPTSPFGSSTTMGGGFGAFSSVEPAKFGTGAGFGFGSSTPTPSIPPRSEDSMNSESEVSEAPSSFGGLSLGGSSSSDSKSVFGSGTTGMFGQSALSPPPDATNPDSGSAFSSSNGGFIKPASGFGAFATTSLQAAPSTTSKESTAKPATSSAFGKSGFEAAGASPAFGKSSFDKPTGPAFGHSSFGNSAFGQSSFNATTAHIAPVFPSSGGGFGAFAQGGLTSFGAAATNQTGGESKSIFGGGKTSESYKSAFGGGSPFGSQNQESRPVSVDGSAAFGGAENKASNPASDTPRSVFAGGIFGDAQDKTPSPAPGTPKSTGRTSVFAAALDQTSTSASSSEKAFISTQGEAVSPALEMPKSVFGGQTRDVSPNSPEPGSPGTDKSSPPPSPTLPPQVMSSSPSPFGDRPSSVVSSPFKSSTPTSGTGAFSQLTSSSSGFMRPASGFGAFGADSEASSPFFNPPQSTESKPVSVFASTTPPRSGSVATPVFGSTSTIGASAGSPFGSVSPPVVASPKPTAPTTGAFSAFSGSSSGFGAFGGPAKSFSDLLKGGDNAKDPSKPSSSTSSALPSAPTEDKKSLESAQKDRPPASEFGPPAGVQVSPQRDTADDSASGNVPAGETTPESPRKHNGEGDNADKGGVSKEPSIGSLSASSASSSFVEVSPPSDEETTAKGHENASGEEDETDDETQSFLSESVSETSESEGSPDDEPSGGEEDEVSALPSPEEALNVPLPATPRSSRSPSTTPKAEGPKVAIKTPSPPPDASESPQLTPPVISTTPPGSPSNEASESPTPAKPPTPTPAPVAAVGAVTSPFGLGIGRPSTRPARSSPLAVATPLSTAEEEQRKSDPPKSAPAVISAKPHPASPKPPFGLWTGPPKPEPAAAVNPSTTARPNTPPLLSNLSAPITKPAPFSLSPSATPPGASPSTGGFFGTKPTPLVFGLPAALPTPPSPMSPFGSKPPTSPSPPASLFGSFSPVSSPSPSPPVSLLGNKPPAPSPVSLSGGNPVPSQGFVGATPVTAILASPEPSLEQGMQAECAYLFSSLAKELEDLRILSQQASQKRADLGKPSPGHKRKSDLGDPDKWALGDVVQYSTIMKQLENDISEMKEQREAQMQVLRELECSMLKAGTRKEEVARFNKAKTDKEFAKMLKVRTLGPEHVEAQSQLRRDIRTMRDRVQKLEDHLQDSKKKLNQLKTGKPGLRPPSLDTVNRTYRNIDVAIEHQATVVAALSARLATIDLSSTSSLVPGRDKRLPDASPKTFNVTPHVAVTTAAALNAERSAYKLKRALLAARSEPLLNTAAATAATPPTSFDTPPRLQIKREPASPGLFNSNAAGWTPPPPTLPVSTGENSFFSSPSPSGRLRASGGTKHHSKPVPLRKNSNTSTQSPPAAPPSFDWGPLPSITPMQTLSADVRPKSGFFEGFGASK